MQKKILIAALIVLINFTACIREVDLALDKQNTLPVINALVTPEEDIHIRLSITAPILDDLPIVVKEATVKLYENENQLDNPELEGDDFVSNYSCQTNQIYKITIDMEGFDTATAIDTMPQPPQVSVVDFQENAYTDAYGSRMGQIILNIQDQVDKVNYYEIVVIKKYYRETYNPEEDTFETIYTEDPTSFDEELNDPVFFNEDLLQYYPTSMVFSDDFFKNENYTLKANFWNHLNGDEEDMTYSIIFRSISKNYYDYKKTLTKHQNFQEGDVWELEIAPVEMFSNVKNGLGIFACYQEVKFDMP